mmetsp:Transcript_29553/g.66731  ORF Transcript_29553/g.66731 Transcript_29553/m.66731 type:complete len:84 (-) Transcript_29553:1981-2232(-)
MGLRVPGVKAECPRKSLKSLLCLSVLMLSHAEVTMEHRTHRIQLQSPLKMVFRQLKFLLAKKDSAQAIPGIIVLAVDTYGIPI